MKLRFRSSCMIASVLDLIGDKWSIVIVRDMLLHMKKTFKEFSASDEKVASNLLSSRLKYLESIDIISKTKLPNNKKENIYLLTEKGIDLTPIIMELVLWSDKYVREYNLKMNENNTANIEKRLAIENVQKKYREFAKEFANK